MKDKVMILLYFIIRISIPLSLLYAILNSSGESWALFVCFVLINIFVSLKKEFDKDEDSFINAETMAHSFFSGLLLVNTINYFKGDLFDNPVWITLNLISLISIVLLYLEDPNEKKEPTIVKATSLIIFNFIPALLIAYFIEKDIQNNTVEFINIFSFLFGLLVIHFIIKKFFNSYYNYKKEKGI